MDCMKGTVRRGSKHGYGSREGAFESCGEGGRLKERRSPLRPSAGAKVTVTPAGGFTVLVAPVKLKMGAAALHRDRLRPQAPPTGSALPGSPSGQGDTEGRPLQPLMRIYLPMAISKRPQRVLPQHICAWPTCATPRGRSSAPLADRIDSFANRPAASAASCATEELISDYS